MTVSTSRGNRLGSKLDPQAGATPAATASTERREVAVVPSSEDFPDFRNGFGNSILFRLFSLFVLSVLDT